MLTFVAALFLVFIQPPPAVSVEYKRLIEPGEPITFEVKNAKATASVNWRLKGVNTLPGPTANILHAWGRPGKYVGRVTVIDWDAKQFVDEDVEFEIKGSAPVPPPGPTPGPTPPPPSEAPFPCTGLHLLITYEASDQSGLTPGQSDILYSAEFREYLDSVCVREANGKTYAYRIFDKDVKYGGETPTWQAAVKAKTADVPGIVISNGVSGFKGPLPKTIAEAKALIDQYKGAGK